uniref:Uncharacterized protein n=1 Tax=Aegilops tauschii subsp. strangulata TaxID=200361 RepID=A0A453S620_AEGTS
LREGSPRKEWSALSPVKISPPSPSSRSSSPCRRRLRSPFLSAAASSPPPPPPPPPMPLLVPSLSLRAQSQEPGSLPHRTMVGEGELRASRRSQPPGAVLSTQPTARCHQRLLRCGRGTTWAWGTCQRGCVGAGVVSMRGTNQDGSKLPTALLPWTSPSPATKDGTTLSSAQPNQGPKLLERPSYALLLALAQIRLLPRLRLHLCSDDLGRSSSRSGGPWCHRRRPWQEKRGLQRRPDLSDPRAAVRPPSRIICLFS